MSYANGTTHYNLPQTLGTDKRDWFDTNEAFAAIDAAIFGAVQTSSEVSTQLTALAGRVTTAEGNIGTLGETVAEHGVKISTLEGTVGSHTTQIADVRQDAEDMICAYNEGSAQTSTHAYAVGDYFIYNDVLYKATAIIAAGDTIVPNTNCEATNVSTELDEINTSLTWDETKTTVLTTDGEEWTATDDGELWLVGKSPTSSGTNYVYLYDTHYTSGTPILSLTEQGATGLTYSATTKCFKGHKYKLSFGGFTTAICELIAK